MDNLNIKRLKKTFIIYLLLFSLLGARLYSIQIVNEDKYTKMALNQRSKNISLNPERGIIYDRNQNGLTNIESDLNIIMPKKVLDNDEKLFRDIENNTSLSRKEFVEKLETNEYMIQIPLEARFPLEEEYSNVFFVDMVKRYKNDNLLSHVVGYVNKSDNSGAYGVEKVYDEYLKNKSSKSLMVEYDRSRSIILGGTEYVDEISDPNNPAGVRLTIDLDIQKIIEGIMDENQAKGSIIVANVEDASILAMASRPNFNQDNIEEHFSNDDMALYNKSIQVGYPPGSIFKIVVLLAALEADLDYDIMEEEFYCPGYAQIDDIKINCSGNHHEINVSKGFEKSCNTVFIELGKKIGAKKIIEKAEELGFGQKINIGLLEEISGNLPKKNDILGPAIGNISIGQGKIEVTPLQITNMMLILANRGIQKHMTVIEGITNTEGKVLKEFNKNPDKRIVLEENAEILNELLMNVVKYGTARDIDLWKGNYGGAGGKTGTAQAIYKGELAVHGWFTGFYPGDNPKYIITVLIEDAYYGSKSATPIFEQISKELSKNFQ